MVTLFLACELGVLGSAVEEAHEDGKACVARDGGEHAEDRGSDAVHEDVADVFERGESE